MDHVVKVLFHQLAILDITWLMEHVFQFAVELYVLIQTFVPDVASVLHQIPANATVDLQVYVAILLFHQLATLAIN